MSDIKLSLICLTDSTYKRTLKSEVNLAPATPYAVNLPNEIWLSIFESVWMSTTGLSVVRLVCRLFGSLVKPLLFRTFTMRPVLSGRETQSSVFGITEDALTDIKGRLEYFSSPEIAPFVGLVRIYPQRYRMAFESDGDSLILLKYFFQLLPRFVYLQTLYCEDIPFNDYGIRQLCQLEHLRNLRLRDCIITTTNIARHTLKVTNLEFHSSSSTLPSSIESYVRWLTLPQLDSIRRLCLSMANADLAQGILCSLSTDPYRSHTSSCLMTPGLLSACFIACQ